MATKSVKPNAVSASLSRSGLMAGSLFGTKANNEAKLLPLSQIALNPEQPRRSLDEARLKELAEDIKLRGVLQPPIVRPLTDGDGPRRYQLVVGERRFRAAQLAGLSEIPVIVHEYDDQEAGAVSLVENLLREDLSLTDEALYFKKLTDDYQLSTRQIGKLISKGHLYVYRRLKLLQRPDLLQQVQTAQLNLNTAVEMIAQEAEAEAAEKQSKSNSETAVSGQKRFSGKQHPPSEARRAWQKLSRFSLYLQQTLPEVKSVNDEDKAALRETIEQLEDQLAIFKRKLK